MRGINVCKVPEAEMLCLAHLHGARLRPRELGLVDLRVSKAVQRRPKPTARGAEQLLCRLKVTTVEEYDRNLYASIRARQGIPHIIAASPRQLYQHVLTALHELFIHGPDVDHQASIHLPQESHEESG